MPKENTEQFWQLRYQTAIPGSSSIYRDVPLPGRPIDFGITTSLFQRHRNKSKESRSREPIQCDPSLLSDPVVKRIRECVTRKEQSFAELTPLFQEVLQSGLATAALKSALFAFAGNSTYQLERYKIEPYTYGWTFLVTDVFAMSIGICSNPSELPQPGPSPYPSVIQPQSFDMFFGLLSEAELTCRLYEVNDYADDKRPELHFAHDLRLRMKDGLLLEAGKDVIVIEGHTSFAYLEITGRSSVNLLPQFDAKNHAFVGWLGGDPQSARAAFLLRSLVDLEYQDAISLLCEFSQHQDHFVRWAAIEQIWRCHERLGLMLLREACDDPCPDIREAARLIVSEMER